MLDAVPTMNPKVHAESLTPDNLVRKFWPSAMIALGLGLSAAWLCLLGYGVVIMIEIAIQ